MERSLPFIMWPFPPTLPPFCNMQTLQPGNFEKYNSKENGWDQGFGRTNNLVSIACRDEWKNSAQEDANLLLQV